ncbi:MAG: glycosyltransferase [Enterococcus sp.]
MNNNSRNTLDDVTMFGLIFLMVFSYPFSVLVANLDAVAQGLAVVAFFIPIIYVVYNITKDADKIPKHIKLLGLFASSFWVIQNITQLMISTSLIVGQELGAYKLWFWRFLPSILWLVITFFSYLLIKKVSFSKIMQAIKFFMVLQILLFLYVSFVQLYNFYMGKAGMNFLIQTPDYLVTYLLTITPLSFLIFFKNKIALVRFKKNYVVSLAVGLTFLAILVLISLSASPVENTFNFEAMYFLDNLFLNYGQLFAAIVGMIYSLTQTALSILIFVLVLESMQENWKMKTQVVIQLFNGLVVISLLFFSTYLMSVDLAEISEATKMITFTAQTLYILAITAYGYYIGLKKYTHPIIKTGLYVFPSFVFIYTIYNLSKIWTKLPEDVINKLLSVQHIFLIISLFVILYYTFETALLWVAYSRRKKVIDLGPIAVEKDYDMYVMIPCMNEELVIGNTLSSILESEYKNLNVIVIDDASEDGTASKVQAFDDPRVRLIQRVKPHAQEGKGEALNYVYNIIKEEIRAENKSFDDVLIAIIDADTLLPEQYFEKVNFVFNNRKDITGLQSKVRVISQTRDASQDLEFAEIINATQTFRSMMGTVAFGGNGQFCKLATLDQLNEAPWSKSLVEDFDLSTRLFLLEDVATRNIQLDDIYITQSGIDHDTEALVKQRVRWSQGNIQSIKYILPILRSKTMENKQKFEFMMTLFKPWLMLVEYLIVIYTFVLLTDLFLLYGLNELMVRIILIFFIMVFYILFVNFVWSWLYNRNKKQKFSILKVFKDTYFLSKFLLTLSQIYPQAAIRHFKSESGWDKTRRQGDLKENDSTK